MRVAAALVVAALLLAGCSSGSSGPSAAPSLTAAPPSSAVTRAVARGVSTPVEDRVYPDTGDPGVDALHYDLGLDWDPTSRTLTGTERLRLRATADADHLQLALGKPLQVTRVTVDGSSSSFTHHGTDLVIREPVTEDDRYTLEIHYSGRPAPVRAPTTRSDISRIGWTDTRGGGAWTMQEPYGAFTWYAVNDQPSDKALYDITITAPAPYVGVANGTLISRTRSGPDTVRRWALDEPVSSYLVTVAVDRFTTTSAGTTAGVPITYWTPPGRSDLVRRLRYTPKALAWVERRLGPLPFGSLGILVVDSDSGMETQTMITLGDTRYATSREVLVHEIAHQWYGDEVTPTDWRDVWMNEGMATYLQAVWSAAHGGRPLASQAADWASLEPQLRADSGPPADYDPATFAEGNVYYIPALMWDQLRKKVGDQEFWRLVRAWPQSHRFGNAGYDDITAWWSQQTGQDLSGFFHDWLLGTTNPATGG